MNVVYSVFEVSILNDLICGYELDSFQKDIVLNNNKHVLVVAGAGSGKTLTILGKNNYLIKYLGVKEDEIICISFTNKTCDSLMKKLSDNVIIIIKVITIRLFLLISSFIIEINLTSIVNQRIVL